MNILVIGCGTQGLAIVRSLRKLGHRIYILSEEVGNYADASRFCSIRIRSMVTVSDDDYLPYIISLIEENGIDAIIPMGDASALFLSAHLEEIQKVTRIKIPNYDVFLKGYDKNQLMSFCKEKGYPHPWTVDMSTVSVGVDSLKTFPFPAMLKPNITSGGRGMIRVESYGELVAKYDGLHRAYGEYHLQEYIPSGGRQFKVQLYIDEQKKLVQGTAMQKIRWFPPKAGSNCCGVSIKDEGLVDLCYGILKSIGWLGFADFDIIEDPRNGSLLVMEMNPRVPACIQLPIAAGVNWPEIILNGYLDLPQKSYDYRPGIVLRHLGLDVLWFVKSENRWRTKPNWFRLIGRDVYYQDMSDWTDPVPFFAGTVHNIKCLLNQDFKKSKGLK